MYTTNHLNNNIPTIIEMSWTRTPNDKYIVNVDGAFNHPGQTGGVGGVIRDFHGNWIIDFSQRLLGPNSLYTWK